MKRTIATMCVLMACIAMMGQVTKEFQVTKFSSIKFATSGKVIYKMGSKYTVEAEGTKEVVDNLEVSTDGGTLTISQKKDFKRNNKGTDLVVTITAPSLSSVNITGVCTFQAYSINTSDFELTAKGVANINIDLVKCDNLDIKVTGVASIGKLDAQCKRAEVGIPGVLTGKMSIEATHLNIKSTGVDSSTISFKGNSCKANYQGTASCKLNVDCKDLSASTSGVAKLTVTGVADAAEINSSGVSKIITKGLNKI